MFNSLLRTQQNVVPIATSKLFSNFYSLPSSGSVLFDKIQLRDITGAQKTTQELFSNKKIVLFGVPGAFTPTCSAQHAPGFVNLSEDILKKGVDDIYCLSVNDNHVLKGWEKSLNSENKIKMLADANANFTKALGLDIDLEKAGLGGIRCKRFSMIIENGEIQKTFIEESPGKLELTTAENMLNNL